MKQIIGVNLAQRLIAEGLVPADCQALTLAFTRNGVPVIHYDLALTTDRLRAFQRAFVAYLDDLDAQQS